jgi:hypothetical protein
LLKGYNQEEIADETACPIDDLVMKICISSCWATNDQQDGTAQ